MEEEVEMQPLRSADSPPPQVDCIVCLLDDAKPSKPDDVRITICQTHNTAVHLRCLPRLMGSNWYVDCPYQFSEPHQYEPKLVANEIPHRLDYSMFTMKKSLYIGWIFAVCMSVALNVFATFSINDCDFQVYQNSCYIAGVSAHTIGSLILILLFFYYRPTVVTYLQYNHDYVAINRKLISEIFILSLAGTAGIPLLVLIGEVLSAHLVLGVWIGIISGIVNPTACFAIAHALYEIKLQFSSAEVIFTPVQVKTLWESPKAEPG